MATKSFTSSSVKVLNNHQSLEYAAYYYQIKDITMMKKYDQSVEINHIQIGPIFLTIPIKS